MTVGLGLVLPLIQQWPQKRWSERQDFSRNHLYSLQNPCTNWVRGISIIFRKERHEPFPLTLETYCFHCKRNLKLKCFLVSMIGEVVRREIHVHNLNQQNMWVLQYLYFQSDVLLVKKEKRESRKKREESHLYLVSIVRTTLYKFLIYPPINYF